MNEELIRGPHYYHTKTKNPQQIQSQAFLQAVAIAKKIGLGTKRRTFDQFQRKSRSFFYQKIKSNDIKFLGTRVKLASQDTRQFDSLGSPAKTDHEQDFKKTSHTERRFKFETIKGGQSDIMITLQNKFQIGPNKIIENKRKTSNLNLQKSNEFQQIRPKTSSVIHKKTFIEQFQFAQKKQKYRMSQKNIQNERMSRIDIKRKSKILSNDEHLKQVRSNIREKSAILRTISKELSVALGETQPIFSIKIDKKKPKKNQYMFFNKKKHRFQFKNPCNSFEIKNGLN